MPGSEPSVATTLLSGIQAKAAAALGSQAVSHPELLKLSHMRGDLQAPNQSLRRKHFFLSDANILLRLHKSVLQQKPLSLYLMSWCSFFLAMRIFIQKEKYSRNDERKRARKKELYQNEAGKKMCLSPSWGSLTYPWGSLPRARSRTALHHPTQVFKSTPNTGRQITKN